MIFVLFTLGRYYKSREINVCYGIVNDVCFRRNKIMHCTHHVIFCRIFVR